MKVSGRTGNHVVFRMKSSNIKPSAVVLCLTATGLSVARSLGANGIEVYGVDPHKCEIGHFSKYVRDSSRLSCKQNQQMLLDHLVNYAQGRSPKSVLFAAGDDEVQFVSEHADMLREHFIMPESCKKGLTGVLLDKIGLYKKCMELGAEAQGPYEIRRPNSSQSSRINF